MPVKRIALAVIGLALGACGAPEHQNPFDPSTPPPLQARASLAGQVSLESLGATEANPIGIPSAEPVLSFLLSVSLALLAVGVIGSLAALLARFRRSAGTERKQIKWLVYAMGANFFLSVLSSIFAWLWPSFRWAC